MANREQSIVITGMGSVTPLGESVQELHESLRNGRSGITQWKRRYDDHYSQIGGDMSDFNIRAHLNRVGAEYPEDLKRVAKKPLRSTPLSGQLTAAAAMQAYVDSCLTESAVQPERCAHILAGHNLNSPYIFTNNIAFQDEPEYIDPLYGICYLDTDVLAVISQILNLRGPNFLVGGACASGNLALLAALDTLRAGRADVAVVSGGACPLGPVTRQGWAMIGALAIKSFNGSPTEASRPFDAGREGFVPSEGAAAVVLETEEHARARNAKVYAHLLGAASTCNASRLTHPDPDAQARVMRLALADARLQPTAVEYVNAHATSTPVGDAAEVDAVKTVFGEHAYSIPINASKSLTGHCLTSAAIVELVATIIQMQNRFVHPTINQVNADPELDLDFVPNRARNHRFDIALSNAFGFGGLNACVVIGREKIA